MLQRRLYAYAEAQIEVLDGESNYVPKENLNEITCKFIQAKNKRWSWEKDDKTVANQ